MGITLADLPWVVREESRLLHCLTGHEVAVFAFNADLRKTLRQFKRLRKVADLVDELFDLLGISASADTREADWCNFGIEFGSGGSIEL